RAILASLAALGADQLGDLGLHQLLDHPGKRVADRSVCSSLSMRLTTSSAVILVVSAIVVLLSSNIQQVRRSWAPRWPELPRFRPAPSGT
ncbi:MAG: hypothetical protein M3417_03985, partial [Actinomycetota bacterium]|nr:hypothetical protein [Actinomycetota bacterium]